MNKVYAGPSIKILQQLQNECVDMIYIDPPFGTGDVQCSNRKLAGKVISKIEYSDKHPDYLDFLRCHLGELYRVLKQTGTMYLHLDYRWVHYAKVICDEIFGYDNFLNEIVWSYNFGGRGKSSFPAKHDNILVYAKNKGQHIFNYDEIDRIPYKAPEMQSVGRTKEDAMKRVALGQIPTDVWEMSIVGTNAKERVGYPSQKPVKLIKRCIVASSPKNGLILDCFAGSGTTGQAALSCGRNFILIDQSPESINVIKKRFALIQNITFISESQIQ